MFIHMYYVYKKKWFEYANFIAYFAMKYLRKHILYTIVDMWTSFIIFHSKRLSKDPILLPRFRKSQMKGNDYQFYKFTIY